MHGSQVLLAWVASGHQLVWCSGVPSRDVNNMPCSQRILESAARVHGPASRARNAAPNGHAPCSAGPDPHVVWSYRCAVASGWKADGRDPSGGSNSSPNHRWHSVGQPVMGARPHQCVAAGGMKPYRCHASNGATRCNGRAPRSAVLGHNAQVVPPPCRTTWPQTEGSAVSATGHADGALRHTSPIDNRPAPVARH